MEWGIYKEWHKWLISAFSDLRLDGFVYVRSVLRLLITSKLQTSPTTCYERLKKRNRVEESGVSLDYLQSLHQRHEDWLIHKKPSISIASVIQNVPILVLNCDEEFIDSPSRRSQMILDIKNFTSRL